MEILEDDEEEGREVEEMVFNAGDEADKLDNRDVDEGRREGEDAPIEGIREGVGNPDFLIADGEPGAALTLDLKLLLLLLLLLPAPTAEDTDDDDEETVEPLVRLRLSESCCCACG
jgi:hypothetical protein